MSTAAIEAFRHQIDRSHGMLVQFIKTCPDEIWSKKFGGFMVWQQAFHPVACYDFFVRGKDAKPISFMFGDEEGDVVSFKKAPATPKQDEVLKVAEKAKQCVEGFISSLKDDAELALKHEGASSRLPFELKNIDVLTMLVSHDMYHLGCCDAALREHGLPGIF